MEENRYFAFVEMKGGRPVIRIILPSEFANVEIQEAYEEGMATGRIIEPVDLNNLVGHYIVFTTESPAYSSPVYGFIILDRNASLSS